MNDKETPCRANGEVSIENRSLRTFERGTQLYGEGEPIAGVYFLQSGRVAMLRRIEGSNHSQTHIATAGDILGMPDMLDGTCYRNSAVALEVSFTRFLTRTEFLELIRAYPGIIFDSMKRICERIEQLESHAGAGGS